MDTLIKDIRVGIRSLRKRPAFTVVAILTLALGIGASTAIFSVVDGVLLRPLPYPHAEQLVQFREVNPRGIRIAVAEPNFVDVRTRSRVFSGVAQYSGSLTTVIGGSEPVRALTYAVSTDFFNVIDVKPIVGRTFTQEESRTGTPLAVVSYGFWQRLLGAKSDLSGTTLHLMDMNVAVVGVMPQGLGFPQSAEVWVPREMFPAEVSRSAHNWSVIARLQPSVSLDQARAELSGIGKQLRQENGKDMDSVDFTLVPQQEYVVGNVRKPLMMILVAVGFLLIVACVNVANLLLAQVTTRQRDFAVRSALGATRFRLARQFITENLLLAIIAGVLGGVISFWGVKLLLSLNRQALPRVSEIGVDTRAIVFTLALSFVVAILLGFVPLLRFSVRELEKSLREAGTGARGFAGRHLRGSLVVAQMALTLVLMICAGLLAKSFYRLMHIDPGFRTERTVAMDLSLPSGPRMDEARYKQFMQSYKRLMEQGIAPEANTQLNPEEEHMRLFQAQLLEGLGSTPGVIASGIISDLPLGGDGPSGTFLIDDNPSRKGNADYRSASSGYFAAMQIPVLRGRMFDTTDVPTSPNAAVVSQSLVQKYWPNENPIGQTVQFGNMDGDLRLLHIVGVVGDVHAYGLDRPTVPTIYGNALQRLPSSDFTVVARGQGEVSALVPAMREVVKGLDAQLPLKFRTLDDVFSSSLDSQRFSLVIFSVFGVAALLLAAMGIYGVTSYAVAQRTQEIGIRMALGAQMKDVLKLVLRGAMALVIFGAIVGIAGAYAATRVMSSLLFGVTATDLATFIAVPLVLFVVALVASLVPARRATRVDPLVALRYE